MICKSAYLISEVIMCFNHMEVKQSRELVQLENKGGGSAHQLFENGEGACIFKRKGKASVLEEDMGDARKEGVHRSIEKGLVISGSRIEFKFRPGLKESLIWITSLVKELLVAIWSRSVGLGPAQRAANLVSALVQLQLEEVPAIPKGEELRPSQGIIIGNHLEESTARDSELA